MNSLKYIFCRFHTPATVSSSVAVQHSNICTQTSILNEVLHGRKSRPFPSSDQQTTFWSAAVSSTRTGSDQQNRIHCSNQDQCRKSFRKKYLWSRLVKHVKSATSATEKEHRNVKEVWKKAMGRFCQEAMFEKIGTKIEKKGRIDEVHVNVKAVENPPEGLKRISSLTNAPIRENSPSVVDFKHEIEECKDEVVKESNDLKVSRKRWKVSNSYASIASEYIGEATGRSKVGISSKTHIGMVCKADISTRIPKKIERITRELLNRKDKIVPSVAASKLYKKKKYSDWLASIKDTMKHLRSGDLKQSQSVKPFVTASFNEKEVLQLIDNHADWLDRVVLAHKRCRVPQKSIDFKPDFAKQHLLEYLDGKSENELDIQKRENRHEYNYIFSMKKADLTDEQVSAEDLSEQKPTFVKEFSSNYITEETKRKLDIETNTSDHTAPVLLTSETVRKDLKKKSPSSKDKQPSAVEESYAEHILKYLTSEATESRKGEAEVFKKPSSVKSEYNKVSLIMKAKGASPPKKDEADKFKVPPVKNSKKVSVPPTMNKGESGESPPPKKDKVEIIITPIKKKKDVPKTPSLTKDKGNPVAPQSSIKSKIDVSKSTSTTTIKENVVKPSSPMKVEGIPKPISSTMAEALRPLTPMNAKVEVLKPPFSRKLEAKVSKPPASMKAKVEVPKSPSPRKVQIEVLKPPSSKKIEAEVPKPLASMKAMVEVFKPPTTKKNMVKPSSPMKVEGIPKPLASTKAGAVKPLASMNIKVKVFKPPSSTKIKAEVPKPPASMKANVEVLKSPTPMKAKLEVPKSPNPMKAKVEVFKPPPITTTKENVVKSSSPIKVEGIPKPLSSMKAEALRPPASMKAKVEVLKPPSSTKATVEVTKPPTPTKVKKEVIESPLQTKAKEKVIQPLNSTKVKESVTKMAPSTKVKIGVVMSHTKSTELAKPSFLRNVKEEVAKPSFPGNIKEVAKSSSPKVVKKDIAKPASLSKMIEEMTKLSSSMKAKEELAKPSTPKIKKAVVKPPATANVQEVAKSPFPAKAKGATESLISLKIKEVSIPLPTKNTKEKVLKTISPSKFKEEVTKKPSLSQITVVVRAPSPTKARKSVSQSSVLKNLKKELAESSCFTNPKQPSSIKTKVDVAKPLSPPKVQEQVTKPSPSRKAKVEVIRVCLPEAGKVVVKLPFPTKDKGAVPKQPSILKKKVEAAKPPASVPFKIIVEVAKPTPKEAKPKSAKSPSPSKEMVEESIASPFQPATSKGKSEGSPGSAAKPSPSLKDNITTNYPKNATSKPKTESTEIKAAAPKEKIEVVEPKFSKSSIISMRNILTKKATVSPSSDSTSKQAKTLKKQVARLEQAARFKQAAILRTTSVKQSEGSKSEEVKCDLPKKDKIVERKVLSDTDSGGLNKNTTGDKRSICSQSQAFKIVRKVSYYKELENKIIKKSQVLGHIEAMKFCEKQGEKIMSPDLRAFLDQGPSSLSNLQYKQTLEGMDTLEELRVSRSCCTMMAKWGILLSERPEKEMLYAIWLQRNDPLPRQQSARRIRNNPDFL